MRSFFLLICTLCFHAIPAQDAAEQMKLKLQAYADQQMVAGIVAGVVQNDEIIFLESAGVSGEDQQFDPGTVTRVASIAKPMTSIAVMQLVEADLIDLDAPLETYLDDFPQWSRITPRQLLAHTSGIGAYKNDKEAHNTDHYNSIEEAVDIFKFRPLETPPGEEYAYTTYGYVVLGLLIERVSGMSYAEYMRENIFRVSGMQHTYIFGDALTGEQTTELYTSNGKGKVRYDKRTDLSDRIPGGGILSTATDILRFADAVMDDELTSEEAFEEIIEDTGAKTEGNPYGLGWYLYGENPRLGNTIGHTGSQAGCSAHLFVFPQKDAAVVVLSNTFNAMEAVTGFAVELFTLIEE